MGGLRLFSEKEMTGHKLFQEMKMTGLPLFSEKKMTGQRLFWGLKISYFPLCRTINFAPSLSTSKKGFRLQGKTNQNKIVNSLLRYSSLVLISGLISRMYNASNIPKRQCFL